jgi:hypothetical protein
VVALAALALLAAMAVAWLASGRMPVEWGAAAILHPWRRPVTVVPRLPFQVVTFSSGSERLEGWLFRGDGKRRGLIVFLHGIADNRQSGIGVADRMLRRGYDVFTFDARAHGRSSGSACTYGYHERHDVSRALDALGASRAILVGHSLGAAVALQAAAGDERVTAVVAASAFSDLPTIVRERARWFHLPERYVEAVLVRAGEEAHFSAWDASPVVLADRITVPVLLLHGAADRKTPSAHSQRIHAALHGPRRLVVLPGVGHDEILGREEAWREIESFLGGLEVPSLPATPPGSPRSGRR